MGPRRPGDLERLVASSEKAQKILGWKAEKNLKDMCESCVKFTVLLLEITRKDKAHDNWYEPYYAIKYLSKLSFF